MIHTITDTKSNRIKPQWLDTLRASLAILVITLLSSGFHSPEIAQAQSQTQVNIIGVPGVLQSPYIDDQRQKYRSGAYQVQFTYTNPNSLEPVPFQFNVQVTRNGKQLAKLTSDPKRFGPGTHVFTRFFDKIPFNRSLDDVINDLSSDIRKQILQGGTLPKGQYMIRITAERPGDASVDVQIPGIASFMVRFPQAPMLITPRNNSSVGLEQPTFSWSPVPYENPSQIVYDFLLVPIYENQTPLKAIQSNRPYAEREGIRNQTVLNYTSEFLPLEPGQRYAWMVTASHIENAIPIRNEGKSQIFTFTYKEEAKVSEEKKISEIIIKPGFARLTDLDRLKWKSRNNRYYLNGQTNLQLTLSQTVNIPVEIENLALTTPIGKRPTPIGGRLKGELPDTLSVFSTTPSLLNLNSIRWRFGTGFRIAADIKLPDGRTITPDQSNLGGGEAAYLKLTRSGLSGMLRATRQKGFYSAGNDTVQMKLSTVSVRFPSGDRNLTGSLELFDGAMQCRITNTVLAKKKNSLSILCNTPIDFSLQQNSAKLQLELSTLTGSASYYHNADSLSYDLLSNANIHLNAFDQSCSASTTIHLQSGGSNTISGVNPTCSGYAPRLHLGLFRFSVTQFSFSNLRYTGSQQWDFDASITGSLYMPSFGGLTLPVTTAHILDGGLSFPSMTFTAGDLNINQPLKIGNLGIKPQQISIDSLTFPWFNWNQQKITRKKAGPWNVSMDLDLSFPELTGKTGPCLSDRIVDVNNLTLKNGSLSGKISDTPIRNCTINFTAENRLVIESLGGSLGGTVSADTLQLDPTLELASHLELGDPFNCGQSDTLDLGEANLKVTPAGALKGTIANLKPPCPLSFGPLKIKINKSKLTFKKPGSKQQILYSAGVAVDLYKKQNAATGSVIADLTAGKFKQINLQINDTFEMGLPRQRPALSFLIGGARIDTSGLHIDGRHKLQLNVSGLSGVQSKQGDTQLGVTFDKAVFDLQTGSLKKGRIIFDHAFGFKLGINRQTGKITFDATDADAQLTGSPAALVKLGSKVMITPNGLSTTGTADAQLNIGGQQFGKGLSIQYDSTFSIGLSPFGIKSGQANFIYKGSRVAYIDRNGFHLLAGALTTALPDTLPMPTLQTAYIVIRDSNGNLKLNAQKQSKPGHFKLSTSSPLQLYLPALQGNKAQVPSFSVSFSNVVYDAGSQELVSGSIATNLNNPMSLQHIGVPLTLTRLRYALKQIGGSPTPVLFVEGNLHMFNQALGQGAKASFFLQNANRVQGSIDLPNLNARLNLVPNSNRVKLHVDSLGGSVDVPIEASGKPQFTFDAKGGFWLYNSSGDTLTGAKLGLTLNKAGLTIDQFNNSISLDSTSIGFGSLGLELLQLNNLNLSYNTNRQEFDFSVGLDLNFLAKLKAGETLEIPINGAQITESSFNILKQTINSNTQGFNIPQFQLGPTTIKVREFALKNDLNFNWFNGQFPTPDFTMDIGMKLSSLTKRAPGLQGKWISLNNIGYNQGVLTGQMIDFTNFTGGSANISFGPNAGFTLTKISGGLVNDSTKQNPLQGFNINLAGRMNLPDHFTNAPTTCKEPKVTLHLETGWILTGTFSNYTPCGQLKYGPATIAFNQNNKVNFAFGDTTRKMVLDGGVTATVKRPNKSDVTATGNVRIDLLAGKLTSGSLTVNGPFPFSIPSTDPFLTFTVKQATIDQRGFILNGSGRINYPNSPDSAAVQFNQFTINPVQGGITQGNIKVQNAIGFQVGLSPIQWKLVDPDSKFKASNAARIVTTANFTIDSTGIRLNGSSKGKLRAGGKNLDSLQLNYTAFTVQFNPVRVTGGKATLIRQNQNKVAVYDKNGFSVLLEGLVKSIIPDTLGVPDRKTAYLVLGDSAGKRVDLQKSKTGPRKLTTKSGKKVELVIPGLKNQQDTLTVSTTFSLQVDDQFNVVGGSLSLAVSNVDLEPYLQIPILLRKLTYDAQKSRLKAALRVELPKSLDKVKIDASAVFDKSGFKQANISAGSYRTTYATSQKQVDPITGDTLGNGALYLYVKGFKAAFGQNKQLAFSGQFKSKMLEDENNNRTPIHYAAEYLNGNWQFTLDAGHVSAKGFDLGFGRFDPKAVGAENKSMEVTMNANEFTLALSGVLTFPQLAGKDFSISIKNMRFSTLKPHVDVQGQAKLPSQQFHLFDKIVTVKTTNTAVTFNNTVIGIELDGNMTFLNQSGISVKDFTLKTDGTVAVKGGLNANLLKKDLEVLPDSSLVLSKLAIGMQNKTLDLTVKGSAELPDPLDARSNLTINADTDGNVSTSGPNFNFASTYSIDDAPTEVKLGGFATLELMGLGLDIDLKHPGNTALYASGVVYVSNNTQKRIMIGDKANLQQNPGIKYAPNQGVKWNISSNFNPNNNPLKFKYKFFKLSITALQATNNVTVEGDSVPFQVTIDAKAGFALKGVQGQISLHNFKFSTKGVDNIGQYAGGSLTIMQIVSLELGTFKYENPPNNQTTQISVKKRGSNNSKKNPEVETKSITVKSYLKFTSGTQRNALKISLSKAFSGGVKRILYYKKDNGTFHLSVVRAKIDIADQATLAASMRYINKQGGGFLLQVAGGGSVSGIGIAAVGKVSTIRGGLKFGIFVAAQAPIPIIPGVIQGNAVGGGFFYQPNPSDITFVIQALKGMGDFETHGPRPNAQNLDLAVMLYAGFTMVGASNASMVKGNTLIQITDQFTKLDANVIYLAQDDRLEGGMYLTAYYMKNKAGVRGGASVEIMYDPMLKGTSGVDFYALSKRNTFIWGVMGNFDLKVIQLLTAEGQLIVSNNGMLLELGVSKGLNLAIISARASFSLTTWAIPQYTPTIGAFGKFRVGFSIVGGLAEFNAAVKGAYMKQPTYHLMYFAGKAHVKVIGVINGTVQGWVKFQTKSPNVAFGRGKNSQMEQMVADARKQAKKQMKQADKTKKRLKKAKNDLNNALTNPSEYVISKDVLRRAGANMLLGNKQISYSRVNAYNNVYWKEKNFYYADAIQDKIAKNIIMGWELGGMFNPTPSYLGIKYAADPQPDITEWSVLKKNAQTFINTVEQNAPEVQKRLEKASKELERLSKQMRAELKAKGAMNIQSPVTSVNTNVTFDQKGFPTTSPSFSVSQSKIENDSAKLQKFRKQVAKMDQKYREAIRTAAANIKLVNLVTKGDTKVKWDVGNKIQIKTNQNQASIQKIGEQYMRAVRHVNRSYSLILDDYWNMSKWAHHRAVGLKNNKQQIKEAVDWGSPTWFTLRDIDKIKRLAIARETAVYKLAGMTGKAQNKKQSLRKDFNKFEKGQGSRSTIRKIFNKTGYQFWYRMPYYGLLEVKQIYRKKARNMYNKYQNKISQVEQSHAAFTQSVDRIYTVKSEMMTTLYGMIQEYKSWREQINTSIPKPPLNDKLNRLKKELMPPYVTKITVGEGDATKSQSKGHRTYFGHLDVNYTASHPIGVPEISVNIKSGGYSSIYSINQFYTSGWLKSNHSTKAGNNGLLYQTNTISTGSGPGQQSIAGYMQTYQTKQISKQLNINAAGKRKGGQFSTLIPKRSFKESERTMTAAIRARGSGGTTIARLANMTIPVEPEQGTRLSTTVGTSDDNTKPTKPVIKHDYNFYRPDKMMKTGVSNTYGSVYMQSMGYNVLSDSTHITFTIQSADKQTGIRRFQYKIGTAPGAGDIKGWTDAQGKRKQGSNKVITGYSYSEGAQYSYNHYTSMNTTIRGLNLKPGTNYYFSFRTINGAVSPYSDTGLKSDVKSLKTAFRYDPTPPQSPEFTLRPSNIRRKKALQTPIIHPPLPDYQSLQFRQPRVNREKTRLTLGRFYTYDFSSKDPESGIKGFSVATAAKPDQGASIFAPNGSDFIPKKDASDTQLSWRRLSYFNPTYVYIRARNHADMKSATQVFGPLYNIDTTPPTTPDARVKVTHDLITIYLTRKADDAQTGIEGYQYAIGTRPDTNGVRPWPDSIRTDFQAPYNFSSRVYPPRVETFNLPSQHGRKLFVKVRAVNGHGMPSRVITTRNVIPDTSAPPKPDITAVYGDSSAPNRVQFTVTNVRDPQTKVTRISYELRPKNVTAKNETLIQNGELPVGQQNGSISAPNLVQNWPMHMWFYIYNSVGKSRRVEIPIQLKGQAAQQVSSP